MGLRHSYTSTGCRHCGHKIIFRFGDNEWEWIHLDDGGAEGYLECDPSAPIATGTVATPHGKSAEYPG